MRACAVLPLSVLSLVLTLISDATASTLGRRDYGSYDYFVLEHDQASGMPLPDVLDVLGLELVEKAGELRDHWLLRRPKYDYEETTRHEYSLRDRAHLEARTIDIHALGLSGAVRHLTAQAPRQRVKRGAFSSRAPQSTDWLNLSSSAVAEREGIVDPEFKDQWHLINEEYPEHMVNAAPVWDMGITGKDVVSCIIDDGLEYESEDLADNFVCALY